MTYQQFQKGIDASVECFTSCNYCAVSCLRESDVQSLTNCIRLNLECSIVCRVTAELLNIGSRYAKEICELCATVGSACADECEKHAEMEYCKACAEACRAVVKETMEIYYSFVQGGTNVNQQIISQNECALISRAAAELMSMESTWCNQICALNTTICTTYADQLDSLVQNEVIYTRVCAKLAKEPNRQLKEEDGNVFKQAGKEMEGNKKKHKRSSALMAASMYRSPVNAVNRNTYISGNIDTTGIWTEFKEEGGIG